MNRKYAVDPEPGRVAFLRQYGQHVKRVPMVTLLLDGRRLRKGLSRMKPGLGAGWVEFGGPPLPPRQAAELARGPPPGGRAFRHVACAPGCGLHGHRPPCVCTALCLDHAL